MPSDDASLPRPFWREPALLAIVAIGVALRLAWLFQPIRYDEAITYFTCARGGVRAALTEYGAPNNHVFHSLLVCGTTTLSNAVWTIRLPAFVAGALVPLAAFHVGRRLHGREAALLGAALVACSAHLIEYATNARGYSIVTLFSLLQVLLAKRIVRHARHADLTGFAIVSALGLFTVPTMLYPTAATIAWAAVVGMTERRATPWRLLLWRAPLYAMLAVAIAVACYWPILSQPGGLERLTSNRFVVPLKSIDAWRGAMAGLGADVAAEWSLGLTRIGFGVAVACAIGGMVVSLFRRRDARASWILVAAIVTVAILFAQRVAPFARVFCFALPMLLLAAGAGATMLLEAVGVRRRWPAISVATCVGLAAYVVVARLPDRSTAGDKFPDAAAVVAFLSPTVEAGDAVIYNVVPSAPIRYTLMRDGRPMFDYRAGARRLWIVTRDDGDAANAIDSRSNRLRADDFEAPRLAYSAGVARVYEAIPRGGRTPPQGKRRG